MYRLTLLLVGLLLSAQVALGQARFQRYIVFTFESTYKITMHGKETYYWIIAVDSLQGQKNLSPLLKPFSRNVLEDCCKARPVAPSVSTTNTSFDFPESYFACVDSLGKIIRMNRKRIQLITTKWHSGQAHKLEVFATPIEGTFCSTEYDYKLDATKYRGKIYLPLMKFRSFSDFWSLAEAKSVERNFAELYFDVFQNSGRSPW